MENAASDLQDPRSPAYPLSGITVIDLSHVYNGPYATFLMAMAGANVIKVEPHGGEHLRSRGDMGGAAMPFAMLNSNKRAVTLDLKTDRGVVLLKEMVARADILVENFAPGVTDRLGIGAAALQATKCRAGLYTQFVNDVVAESPEGIERVGAAAAAVKRVHQEFAGRLIKRMLGGQLQELTDETRVTS